MRGLFPVVGMGASAGGVEAFRQMLRSLRKDTGMAFVLVLHLPPEHDSMLTEILERVSPIPVNQAIDRMPIEPNCACVLPAGADIDIADGKLVLTPRQHTPGYHYSLDHLLHSLAECQREKAIGVILSGSAADGTLGIQEIKAAGGITFAQDDTASYTSMPRSAIATGAIDFVLPPDEIARELGRIASHPLVSAKPLAPDDEFPDLEPILAILRESAGVDFAQYKPSTLYRRIARRVVLHKLDGIAQAARSCAGSPPTSSASTSFGCPPLTSRPALPLPAVASARCRFRRSAFSSSTTTWTTPNREPVLIRALRF